MNLEVSLLQGINTSFDITTFDDGIDKYYLKVDVLGLAC
ncbi:MAG: hypothetical protein CM15mP113_0530 [Pseudomonadota bacterium]|nr:MAG: hypothetical protein CM15mP113_0530 [Pseudomonadota bacterium]